MKGFTKVKKISAYQVLDVIFPVALHYGIMLLTAMLTGNDLDAAAQTTLAALAAFPLLWRLYKKEPRSKGNYTFRSLWVLPFLGMAGNLLFSFLLRAVHLTEHFSNAFQEALFQSDLLIQVIGIGIFVPFVEEVIFRGLVYGKLRRRFSWWAAAAVSAGFFAFYHGNVIQIVYAFPMGLLLAWAYERWGCLLAPVLIHVGANLLGILETVRNA